MPGNSVLNWTNTVVLGTVPIDTNSDIARIDNVQVTPNLNRITVIGHVMLIPGTAATSFDLALGYGATGTAVEIVTYTAIPATPNEPQVIGFQGLVNAVVGMGPVTLSLQVTGGAAATEVSSVAMVAITGD